MGNNCGCFESDIDKLKESSCFLKESIRKQNQQAPQIKIENINKLNEEKLQNYSSPKIYQQRAQELQGRNTMGVNAYNNKMKFDFFLDQTESTKLQENSLTQSSKRQNNITNNNEINLNRSQQIGLKLRNQLCEEKFQAISLKQKQYQDSQKNDYKMQQLAFENERKSNRDRFFSPNVQSQRNQDLKSYNIIKDYSILSSQANDTIKISVQKTQKTSKNDQFDINSSLIFSCAESNKTKFQGYRDFNNKPSQLQESLQNYDFKKFKFLTQLDVYKRYTFGQKLGQGAFGKVFKCILNANGKQFAAKIIDKKVIEKQKIYLKLLQNELKILEEKSHPKIIRIIDLFEDEQNYYIISELVQGGELFQRLLKFNHFSEHIALNIIRQIMLGLNYLHAQSITHRDIKPENILLVSDKEDVFDIKISDLGFACMYDKETGLDLVLGTPIYMAPELIQHKKYTEKIDIWSLGIITYQLLSGTTPFESRNIQKLKQQILRQNVYFPSSQWKAVSQNAKDFILKCLERNQNARPSINELFNHPWIHDYQENASIVDSKVQLNIKQNLVQFFQLNQFQKIVLSLISGLSSTQEELRILQKEFIRINKDKSGTISKQDLEQMQNSEVFWFDWRQIIEECDKKGNGVIDFQEFVAACINRNNLSNREQLVSAFKLIDNDCDGKISLQDFNDIFCQNQEYKIDNQMWTELLNEANIKGNGEVSEHQFIEVMSNMIRKSIKIKK